MSWEGKATLYDEFYRWIDDNMPPIIVPTLLEELGGFEMRSSDFMMELSKRTMTEKGRDYYTDVLYELWYKNKYGGSK